MALVMPSPSHAGSRSQAREMFSGHEAPLGIVLVDCSRQIVGTPSFLDELIRIVLVDREALGLLLDNATERIKTNAERCARNRGVQDRLQVVVRPPPRLRGWFRR